MKRALKTDWRVIVQVPAAALGVILLASTAVAGNGPIAGPAAGPVAPAQPISPAATTATAAPMSPGELDRLVEELQSPEFRVRDEATRRLQSDERLTLAMIERALRDRGKTMSLEGRERLLSVARERFYKSPRGAMGIGFGQEIQTGVDLRDRVIVGQTYEGFDSFKLLEPGDMITVADGQEIRGPDARSRMQAIIVAHDPGEAISVVLRRGKQKVQLNVRLRSFNDLPNTNIDMDRLTRAWRYRSRGYSPPAAEAVRAQVPLDDWEKMPRAEQFAQRGVRRARNSEDHQLPPVVGGGMARGLFQEPDDGRMAPQWVMIRQNGRNVPQWFIGPDGVAEYKRAPMTFGEELTELSMARKKAGIGRPGRDLVTLTDPDTIKRLAMIQKQEDAIRAEMTERGESTPDLNAGGGDDPK